MEKKNSLAVYPGSFDPITFGHIDLIKRALTIFDKVIIAIAENFEKKTLFSVEERKILIEKSIDFNDKMSIDSFNGLTVHYATQKGASAIIRGIRAVADFEFEFKMALMNRRLAPEIEVVYLMPSHKYSFLSSTIVREVSQLGGDVSGLVPEVVKQALDEKFSKEVR
ncbi:pantetheine-phosphate adenylyltransferase [bacterium]|nr:pantetheine-phosphate adenylyltransferase [bacterium]